MTRIISSAFAVAAIFLVSFAAQAQGRGGSGAMSARVAPMPARTARASTQSSAAVLPGARSARQASVIQISPSGRTISGTGSFANSFDFGSENGVPGLGFDYPHLAAVSGNFPGNPPGFGRGGEGHRQRNFVTPLFYGGFPYYSDFGDYYQQEPQQPQQPQVIVIQQPVPAAPAEQSVAPASPDVAQTQPAAAPAPVPEVGELVLVRRDGRVLFASIFTVTGTQVQYVTPEGVRRVLPLSDLDTVATQEMNEARGTTLQFHN
jgi:hypothetical protein